MHEAPKLLTAPKIEPKRVDVPQAPKINVEAILGFLGMLLTVVGILFVIAIRLDPILYVVTEDGTHVEVARWSDYITQ